MSDRLNESKVRWAVVTGGSSGIGAATARLLARDGWNTFIHCRQSRSAAEQVALEVRSLGREAEVLTADFSKPDVTASFVNDVCSRIPTPGAWVHLAGVDLLTGPFAKLPFEEKIRLAHLVDVEATAIICRQVGDRMKASGGVIVTVGWDQAATGMEGDSGQIFALTKGAVAAFSRSLAKSLAPEVRVLCVAPGWIKTAWGERASADWQKRVLNETPLGRWGNPDDVAELIAYLVSDKASFLTGQTINVNGGAVSS